MRKYYVEIQDKKDFDKIMIQSQWFESFIDAKTWYKSLDYFDTDVMTASVMYADFDKEGDFGDICMYEMLTKEGINQ